MSGRSRPVLALDGSFDPQGPAARDIAELWWLMLAAGTAVFALVVVLLLLGLFRRRRRVLEPQEADSARRVRRWVLLGGVVMPLAVLVVVFGATVRALRALPDDVPGDALVVEIVGHQWWWEVHYPDHDVTTANELHLPVGRRVALQLTSADVIHSFWVPALAGKLDLLPDGVNTLVLEADEAGEHTSHCAEFCGLQHAKMRLAVVAEPQDHFDGWLASRAGPAAQPAGPDAERGLEVFLDAGCASCHRITGTPADGRDGPDLTHLASRPGLGALAADYSPAALARWVTDPHTVKPGVLMPSTELSDDDRDALVAYLDGLR